MTKSTQKRQAVLDPLAPSATLLCKLGSIVVHADEGLSSEGHHFDLLSLRVLLADEDVISWLREMNRLALIPRKR